MFDFTISHMPDRGRGTDPPQTTTAHIRLSALSAVSHFFFSTAMVFSLFGCSRLPFGGPFTGIVTEIKTGAPVAGAKVEAEWWCHDSPIPDGPGSYFVRVSTFTDGKGAFFIEKQTRRDGFFGSSFALKITAEGYIPATLIGDKSGRPLPPSTRDYPFIDTTLHNSFPPGLAISLKPAVEVFLKHIDSKDDLLRSVAREGLQRLSGVDFTP